MVKNKRMKKRRRTEVTDDEAKRGKRNERQAQPTRSTENKRHEKSIHTTPTHQRCDGFKTQEDTQNICRHVWSSLLLFFQIV